MADSASTDSPLEAAAGTAGPRATEAFSILGNQTRMSILLALWEAFEPFAEDTWNPTEGNTVPFSELRDRVGIEDPGQFNYHLGKLVGEFVERTEHGYRLLPAGNKLVRRVIASTGFEEVDLPPAEIDLDCFICGAPTAVTYQNQRVYYACTNCEGSHDLGEKHPPGVINAWIADPSVLWERSPEAIYASTLTYIMRRFAMYTGGFCPQCLGQINASLDVCEDHEPGDDEPCPNCTRQSLASVQYVCTVC